MKKIYGTGILILLLMVLTGWFLTNGKGTRTKTAKQAVEQHERSRIVPHERLVQLEEGLSVIRYDQDYGFQEFLDQGGASNDAGVVSFLMENVLDGITELSLSDTLFGCSTVQTVNDKQEVLFGRNFDWENSNALILESHPNDAYASISTVNLNFIQAGASFSLKQLPDDVLARVALYAPLDGMNEKGLAVSVNMIQDSDGIEQKGKQQNLTTTTAIRLLLNKAATVEDAVALLKQYNLHASMNRMIHFAIADAQGSHVAVEYVNNEMKVINTPVVTNFYLSDGEKQGIGTPQSHERYDILLELLKNNAVMDMEQVRDALDRVSKDNFNEFESTEWSIVYNLNQQEIWYYHRENYEHYYVFHIKD